MSGVTVDVSAAEAALDELVLLVREAAFNASVKSAKEIQTIARDFLLTREHAAHTKTPSKPGTPPAAISGDLAGSVLVSDAGDSAFVGPTTDYGRIQELGGRMQGHPMMHWQEPPGVWHHSADHKLPDRPYMKISMELAIVNGSIERFFYDAVARAIAEVG